MTTLARAARVQMSRHKPWRPDHPDAVVVARPGKWGNPYRVGEHAASRAEAVDLYARWLSGEITAPTGTEAPTPEVIRQELGGRDLACWCPLDAPCHADLLLTAATRGSGE